MKTPLHELALWRHLQALSESNRQAVEDTSHVADAVHSSTGWPTDEALAEALSALAERAPRERVAHLGEIEVCLNHQTTAVRRGALEALGGAAGAWALQHQLAGLADEATRETALMALARSCRHDPMQWWHVLLHPDETLRRAAINALPEEFPRYWLLLMLPDQANRALVMELLEPFPEDPEALPLLLSMVQAQEVSRLTCLRWLARLPWEHRAEQYLELLPSKRLVIALPEGLEELEAFLTSPLLESSTLDTLFLLLWQEIERHPQGETGRLARAIFTQIFDYARTLMQRGMVLQVAVSMARIGLHQWSWEPVSLACCGLVMPALLTHRQIAVSTRKQAVALYNQGLRLFDPPEGLLEDLLCSDLCYQPDGSLSLPHLAGVMRLIKHPYKALATFIRPQDIQAALYKTPHHATTFFARAPENQGDQEHYDALLRAFCGGVAPTEVQASLALLVPVYQLPNILRPDATEASRLGLLQALLKAYESSPKSPPEHKTSRIAEQLMPLLIPHLKATIVACMGYITLPSELFDEDAEDERWQRWYDVQPSPEHMDCKPLLLATELVMLFSRHVPHDALIDVIESLPEAQLPVCLTFLSCSPLFSYDAARAIAKRLSGREAPAIVSWCQAHDPAAPPTRMRLVVSEGPQVPSQLEQEDAQKLTTANETALARLLEPYLVHGLQGLCAALQGRVSQAPSVAICSALLVSYEPPEEVAQAFAVHSKATDNFAKQLDRTLVKYCERAPSMPLLGLAWMHRWEHHRAMLQAHFLAQPGGFVHGLRWALHLASPMLALRLWQGIKLIMQQWRWREPDRLAAHFQEQAPGLVTLLRGVLLHHQLPEDQRLAPDMSTDIQVEAARIVEVLVATGRYIEPLQALRMELLTQLSTLPPPLQRALSHWLNARFSTMSRQAFVAPPLVPPALLEEIAATTDLDVLKSHCLAPQAQVIEEAACQLLMLDGGVEALLDLWQQELPVPSARAIASTLPLWPDDADLTTLTDRLQRPELVASNRFFLALGLAERGADTWKAALNAIKEPSHPWASHDDWRQIIRVAQQPAQMMGLLAALQNEQKAYRSDTSDGIDDVAVKAVANTDPVLALAIHLIDVAHEPIQSQALQTIMGQPSPLTTSGRGALIRYLHTSAQAPAALRLEVARRLHQEGSDEGLPLLLASTYHTRHAATSRKDRIHSLFDNMTMPQMLSCIKGALLLGEEHIDLRQMLTDLERQRVDLQARQQVLLMVLRHGPTGQLQQQAVNQLKPTSNRQQHVYELARLFAWGLQKGRELTGKLFKIELLAGEALGYTRLSHARIHINPLPMLRREQYGEDIVKGLILHELGHHIYHADEIGVRTWQQAEEEKLGRLLNLVSDEQLERGLRAKDKAFGNDLKRLAAYAFQHSHREMAWVELLGNLGASAFGVLCGAPLKAARKHSHVVVEMGHLLFALEAHGKSFARFVRALRMGLGNRHKDPKVEEALRLFSKKFRHSTMPQMLEIARSLRDIFGEEIALLDLFDQQSGMDADCEEVVVIGEGMTQEELQRELERQLRGPTNNEKSAPGRVINVAKGEEFRQINAIIPIHHDPAEHRRYAIQTARWSRKMRDYLQRLGLGMVPQRKRLAGHRLDRGQLQNAVLRHDPRILMARKIVYKTDLFLGILIDCSGSMEIADNIEKARLFASMLAEAAAPLKSVDAHFIGFNDTVLYDAGTAQRCAVHGLEVGGGNNDAAALWHAARLALASPRKAKLIVMISDGSPTECTVEALQSLVTRVTDRMGICCAQIALRSLDYICFPHYVEVLDDNVDLAIHQFGTIIARLVQKAIAS